MGLIGELLPYTINVKFKNLGIKKIVLYCKPLAVVRNDFGGIKEYRVLKVYEVEKFLSGENPSSSEEYTFSVTSAPNEIAVYFKTLELYGPDVANNSI